jgi:hypothetical protein
MATRQNFSEQQRQSAFAANAMWLRDHRVTGVELALAFEPLRHRAQVYYCENCLFCHSDQAYFDIDHLVPDRSFRIWQKHVDARDPINMVVLCKSTERGERGCNESRGELVYSQEQDFYSRQDLDELLPPGRRPHEYQVPL